MSRHRGFSVYLATRHLLKLSSGKRVKEVCSHCNEQLCQSSSAGSRAICVLRCRLGLRTGRTKPQPVDFGLINRAWPESDQVWEVFTHIRLSFWFGLCCWDGHGDTGPTSCNTNFLHFCHCPFTRQQCVAANGFANTWQWLPNCNHYKTKHP